MCTSRGHTEEFACHASINKETIKTPGGEPTMLGVRAGGLSRDLRDRSDEEHNEEQEQLSCLRNLRQEKLKHLLEKATNTTTTRPRRSRKAKKLIKDLQRVCWLRGAPAKISDVFSSGVVERTDNTAGSTIGCLLFLHQAVVRPSCAKTSDVFSLGGVVERTENTVLQHDRLFVVTWKHLLLLQCPSW